ncbi:MAG TPA: hypothetical protein VF601_10690 [Beijerinckiaceae bacterium]
MVLHERHLRPAALEYEYATGRLRGALERREFGEPLSSRSIDRLRALGVGLQGKSLRAIVTEDFVVTRETARHLAEAAGLDPASAILFDRRVRESDLSYLGSAEFEELGRREAAGEPNATLIHWIKNSPADFMSLVGDHVGLWNDALQRFAGTSFLFVLHVEGLLLLTALGLGLQPSSIGRLLLPRALCVRTVLAPDRPPTICIGPSWEIAEAIPYASYG